MSFVVAAVGGAIAVGYVISQASQPKAIPTPPAPIAPPQSQAAQLPDANNNVKALGGTGQAGGAPGVAQTFLTGSGGVDPNTLSLGKTSLLGG